MEDKIMKYETTKSSKYRRAFSFLLILLFTVQLVLFFDINETFAEENSASGSTAVDENISYTGSYTLTGQEMNLLIPGNLTTRILSIQMLMIQMQNRQQLQLYLGQVVNMENTGLLHRQLGIEL